MKQSIAKAEYPIVVKDTNDEYHSLIEFLGSSGMKKYKESPRSYKHSLTNNEKTEALMDGGAYHSWIMEPELFDKEHVIFDPENRPEKDKDIRSKLNQEWKKGLYEKYNVITKDRFFHIKEMKKCLFADRFVRSLLTNGVAELSHYTILNGVKVKVRPDYLKKKTITELKTTTKGKADKRQYPREAEKYSHHLSVALYTDVLEIIYERKFNHYTIVQEKTPPYLFNIFHASPQVLAVGQYEYEIMMRKHKQCLESNYWGGYQEKVENEYGVIDWEVPAYGIYDMYYRDIDNTIKRKSEEYEVYES